MASGLNQCAAIAYLSEASPSPVRGASLGGYQVAVSDIHSQHEIVVEISAMPWTTISKLC